MAARVVVSFPTRRSSDLAQRSNEKERTSAETAEECRLRFGIRGNGRARGGMGWESRECDFDAETRRRGDRRREETRKKERARRQRRNVAFGSGFEGTDEPVVEWGGKPESVILTRRRGDAEIGEIGRA